jgi:hypothetical protein
MMMNKPTEERKMKFSDIECKEGRWEHENYVLKIVRDDDPINPREWDNVGTMLCFHRRYNLGDEPYHRSVTDMLPYGEEDLEKWLVEEENAKTILPLYLYDHSGITIRTTPFTCRWDSGQIGYIYSQEEGQEDILRSEIEVYDHYLFGNIWGYQVYQKHVCNRGNIHEEIIDSCYGFYGYDDSHLQEMILGVGTDIPLEGWIET